MPSAPAQSAAELAARAEVSVPAAWRLLRDLKDGGFVDEDGGLCLLPDLLARWRAACQRPQQRTGARWVLPGREPLEDLRGALADVWVEAQPPAACLELFAACDALGVGHVRGAPIHLYVRNLDPDLLERLGLVLSPDDQRPDVLVRVARWQESLFRAVAYLSQSFSVKRLCCDLPRRKGGSLAFGTKIT